MWVCLGFQFYPIDLCTYSIFMPQGFIVVLQYSLKLDNTFSLFFFSPPLMIALAILYLL